MYVQLGALSPVLHSQHVQAVQTLIIARFSCVQAAICCTITAMDDPTKGRPLDYRLPRFPFEHIFCPNSAVRTVSQDQMDCVVISRVLVKSFVLCVLVLPFQSAKVWSPDGREVCHLSSSDFDPLSRLSIH